MAKQEHNSKIKSVDDLTHILPDLKTEGKTVVQCHGVFDLLHPGHIRHLEAARNEGDVLVVTVTDDEHVGKGPGRPVFSQHLRAESLAALGAVDYVAINPSPTAVDVLLALKPDVYAKGSDYADAKEDLTGKISDEENAVKSIGGRLHFTDEITFSSTSLLNDHFDVYPEDARRFLAEFRQRHSAREVIDMIKSLRSTKVLVIGDAIIDEYHYCQPLSKSPKELLIPARYMHEEAFAGGIMAVANHIAGFCDEVHLITCLGLQNACEDFILQHLKPSVKTKLFYRPDAPTTIKRRFVHADLLGKMFEVCFLGNGCLPEPTSKEVQDYVESCAGDYDLVVAADYGHGFLGGNIIQSLCDQAKFLALNVQTNSANMGFNLVTKYPRADYMCIDEVEIRLAAHDSSSEVESLLVDITRKLGCHRAVVTRGHLGSLVFANGGGFISAPVFSREAVDRVGAGDAYFSITSPCVAAELPTDVIGLIGNAVGALAIRIVGNRSSVEPVPLFKYITTLLR